MEETNPTSMEMEVLLLVDTSIGQDCNTLELLGLNFSEFGDSQTSFRTKHPISCCQLFFILSYGSQYCIFSEFLFTQVI